MLIYIFRHQLADLINRVFPKKQASTNGASSEALLITVIDDEAELDQIREAGTGYIFNDSSPGTGPNGEIYKILHAASCPALRSARITEHPKYFAPNMKTAIAWLEASRGTEGKDWKRCDFAGDPINS